MSDLQNLTPANTYKALLQLDAGYTNGISGSTGANALQVSDGAGNNTSLALSTDRVGIGTTSPTRTLHLVDDTNDGSGGIKVQNYKPVIELSDSTLSATATTLTQDDTNFTIANNSVDSLTIDSSGNVGIGTTSPSYELEVVDSSGDAFISVVSPNVDEAGIVFGDADLAARGGVIYDNNDNSLAFRTSTNTEKMRIDSSGNVGIGTTSPGAKLEVNGDIRMSDFELAQSGQTGIFRPYVDSRNCFIYSRDASSVSKGAGIDFGNGFAFRPSETDTQDLGVPTRKWNDIHAVNATIQTSDRELKQDIEELSEAETRVAQACKGLLRKYRWKSSVEEKGDEARIHFGIIAQDLEDAFTAEGLDAGRYGMFVKNTWWTADRVIPAVEAVEAVEAVYDEEGNEVSPAVKAVEAQPEKTVTDIFENSEDAPEGATEVTQRGVRYSELLAFIISAI